MSFSEVERALVDLLFDEGLRRAFEHDRRHALADYALTEDERADFAVVNMQGLALDASLRRDLVLARLARAFPVTFAMASALPGGMAAITQLLGPAYVRSDRSTRTARFGESLRDALKALPLDGDRMRAFAYVDIEVALAWAAARLREGAREPQAAPAPVAVGWEMRPLALVPHLCIAVLPRSYEAVKRELCPVAPDQLWGRLCAAPLPSPRLQAALVRDEPRLFVGRARLVRASRCEATVDHVTLELSAGFAPLLVALDGKRSAASLLRKLATEGAQPRMLEGVRQGLAKLLEQGMLTLTLQS